jgi:hypothetical protein
MTQSLIAYQADILNAQLIPDPKFKEWLDFYHIIQDRCIGLNDRTNTFRFPIRTFVPDKFKLPEFKNSNITYEECVIERASQILKQQENLDLPIQIMYSGGIDSSVIVSSFIKLLGVEEASKRITIKMNQNSVDENPEMWYKFIRPHFKVQNSDFSYSDKDIGNWIYVIGELNDQLFGADIQQSYEIWGGPGSLNKTINFDTMVKFFMDSKKISLRSAKMWTSLFIENLKTCPNHSNQVWDLFWWYNFTWKWIYVYYRLFLFSNVTNNINTDWLSDRYFPFFDTTNFQLWSMNNQESKHLGSWNTYKISAKKFVCSVLGSDEYLQKVKRPSLKNILYLRPRFNAITSDQNVTQSIDLSNVFDNTNHITNFKHE